MANNLRIVFDSPTNSYYAGTTVTGKVIFVANNPKKARGLKIKIEGGAHVEWSKTENRKNANGESRSESVRYYADEEYFSNKYYLIGSANGEIEIPQGEHVYPFQTTLPPRLPTSFDGEHGHIRYTVKATLDRPWKTDFEAKGVFTVITPVDLNYVAVAREPVKKETEKYFCCCCCKSGPLTLVAWVPYTGYTPGQDVPVTIEIDNASSVAVESVECKLRKIIKWTTRNPSHDTKTDVVDLVKMSLEGVEERGSRTWTQNLTMPTMPFVNVDDCSIIDISFLLKVQAVASGCHKNLSTEIPLVLGTVPVNQGGGGLPQMIPQQTPQPGFNPTPGFTPTPGFNPTPGFATGPSPTAPFTNYQDTPQPMSPGAPPYPAEPGVNTPLLPGPNISPGAPPYPSELGLAGNNTPYPPGQNPSPYPPQVPFDPANPSPVNPSLYPTITASAPPLLEAAPPPTMPMPSSYGYRG